MTVETEPRTLSPKEKMISRVNEIYLNRGIILSPEKFSVVTDMALKLDEELSKDSLKRPHAFYIHKDIVVNLAIEMSANIDLEEVRRIRPNIPQIEPFHE